MSLPDLIEIKPLEKPVRAEITVPGSKSITNRALILAALANGETTLRGALWSEDTQVMVDCLEKLGFKIKVASDEKEFCNRTITVQGLGGKIPNAGTPQKPLELFVGNAGTAARFLSAFVCLGNGVYRLSGVPRMHERPQAELFKALRELGYRVESENDKLPATMFGGRSRGDEAQIKKEDQSLLTSSPTKKVKVSIEKSSQFASALLLVSAAGGWQVEVSGENAEESPYVAMTSKILNSFLKSGGEFQVEPDASSGSYFWGAGVISALSPGVTGDFGVTKGVNIPTVIVREWPNTDWQIDAQFPKYLNELASFHSWNPEDIPVVITDMLKTHGPDWKQQTKRDVEKWWQDIEEKQGVNSLSREDELGDSIMTAVIIAAICGHRFDFTDLGRLRVQECERVVALRTELTKCGAKVVEEGDTLKVYSSELHGAEIETYNDHRMAMCFAILGLKVPGIKIKNPSCVKKTFPNFFQKLAAAPPNGLGAVILDAHTQETLVDDELFAE